MITVNDLGKIYGSQVLFREADLQLNAGSRYGIVGANGSGKSTLLRILQGSESADEGEVVIQRRARVGVLEQDHFSFEDVPILEVVMMGNKELWAAMQARDALLANAEEEFDEVRYTELEDIILRFDGYTLESRAGIILEGLNIPTVDHDKPLRVLSGGYKLRALLGQTLASDPDVLLLDEPTNHLDIISIDWLEGFLKSFRGLAVVVSHDHTFLNAICTHIVDVDYSAVTQYKGDYDAFLKLKVEERGRREVEIKRREKEIEGHKAFIARFKAKASKARQANSRQKRMEKIEIVQLAQSSRRYPTFKLKQQRPSGKLVLSVKEVFKQYDDNLVLDDVSFEVSRGERVAIIGPNGIGKSTLLKIAMDEVSADLGETEWGYEAQIGYFPQDHTDSLGSGKQTVLAALWDECAGQGEGFARGKLSDVLFSADDVQKRIENLSGGEAARLLMARMCVKNPNVLVLDEPTNHLDLESIEAMARDLKKFDGTILFVSHDRWFVNQLATRVIEISPTGVEVFEGGYEEFCKRGDDHLDVEAALQKERELKRKGKKGKKKGKKGGG
jgi:ATPase subunit of ABC transporter with duplicated ATPase domains